MGNILVSFLVDTRAAVSLICGDNWDSIKLSATYNNDPVGIPLVGVDGIPL